MAFLRSTRVRDAYADLTASSVVEPADPVAGVGLHDGRILAFEDSFVTPEIADSVPAYRRAKSLVSSQIGLMPLRQIRNSTGEPLPAIPFLRRPDETRVRSAMMTETIADLCDYGVAYWLNPRWDTPAGWRYADAARTVRKHRSVVRLAVEDVLDVSSTAYRIRVRPPGADRYEEETVPAYAVIGFESPAGGWLRTGARAITTARLLEDAARMYASAPVPTTIIRNTGPRKTPAQVDELLAGFEAARRNRGTVYAGRDIEIDSYAMNATEIALSEARATAILDIARVSGVPSIYLSQGPHEASMVYSNQTQARLDLHAAMVPYAAAVEERLSFDDVTGEGVRVEFDFGPFLRVDPMYRADLYSKLIPLGVMTAEQAAEFEALNTATYRGGE